MQIEANKTTEQESTGLRWMDRKDFHVNCNDCGHFLKKKNWVRKDHPIFSHALCSPCLGNYEDTECDNTM